MLNAGIFLDRDDVINQCPPDKPGDPAGYITEWDQFKWHDLVKTAFAVMYTMPYRVFVISNQSGISRENIDCTETSIRKIFTKMEWELTTDVNERINELPEDKRIGLAVHPGGIDSPMVIQESIFCPHLDEHNCYCRKPKPGMIGYLAVKHRIDLRRSWMIGDSISDMKCGWNAGIRNLVRIDHTVEPFTPEPGTKIDLGKNIASGIKVPSLLNAVGIIKAYDSYIERVWGPKKEEDHG